AELYRLTGSAEYHEFFKNRYQEIGGFYALLGWQMTDSFAFLAYLRTPGHQVDQQIHSNILGTLVQHSNDRVAYTNQNGYNYILQPNEFMWGSNAIGLGEALKLIEAFEFTGDEKYRDAALDQLHYNLGRNTFNIAYVTGVGINPVRSPYHQFSNQLGAAQPVPGLAVGGPNRDGGLNGQTLSPFPARSYEDTLNYKVNEVAIYYSAPLTYVSGYFSDFDTSGR
ncbi:MAG: hypothetical protein HOH43_09330, partial [Candidatus Latescibacteria bacterium]|nr:hypothetical protein [Candidatus Latescibacterota bacterium]